jgi:hydrogenase-4 component B
VSEWLIYNASFHLGLRYGSFYFLLGVPVLALIGALAAACFTKAFGVLFLGTPRSPAASEAHESGPLMLIPMLFLAGCCAWIGLFPGSLLPAMGRVMNVFGAAPAGLLAQVSAQQSGMLSVVSGLALLVLAVIGLLAILRYLLLIGKPVETSSTWGCGYASAIPRAQYTSSSYAQFSTALFRKLLAPHVHAVKPAGYFPGEGQFESHTPDAVLDRFLPRIDAGLHKMLVRIQRLQQGQVHFYLGYVLIFLIGLLVWQFHGVSVAWEKVFLLQ